MAAASSASAWKNDVFLSFRGLDTRNTFTVHLYSALDTKGINTFIDDQLERGENISDSLVKVIEGSRISIVIFSADYAGSSSCLEELVKILECQKLRGQLVLPVFYNINPSDVEKQTGCYADSLAELEAQLKVNSEKMREWRLALTEASTLSGWHLDNGNEAKFIQRIVQKVFMELNRTPLHVAEYPVGLESHINKMSNMLSIGTNNVQMVGIYGTGGIGKTTIVKAVFNSIANQFEGSCFLPNVRETSKEKGLLKLQETLLLETLGCKRIKLRSCDRGMNVIKHRLLGRRVLIVIDDVDDLQQLKKLAGELDWFGPGSRIIITTRNEQLLNVHGVKKRYNVEELCPTEALELFSWHAFKEPQPKDGYLDLSLLVIKYAQSLPLALVVLGSFLCGRSKPEWQSQLQKLNTNPNKEICDILRISYDGLENLQKTIFLHIACFFKGHDEDYVMRILDACELNPIIEVKVLAEKSLIRIENNKLEMHDLVQAMGRQVVIEESSNIAERSRLWRQDDVLRVLTEDMGPLKTEALVVDLLDSEEVSAEAFTKMSWLKILIVYNANINGGPKSLPSDLRWLEWSGCPLESMPSRFQARKLVALNMQKGCIKKLDFSFKNYVNLKDLNLRDCHFLTETPDFSSAMNLERLILDGCTKLVEVHQSVGYLEKLEILGLEFCSELRTLPSEFKLRSLRTLLLTGCKKLEMFPEIVVEMKFLEKVCLNGTAIKFLPLSIENITGLKVVTLTYCKHLNGLPLSIYKLKHLKRMLLEGCLKLEKFPIFEGKKVQPSSPVHSSNSRNSSDIYPSVGFPTLKILHLQNCNLSDVDFLSTPNWFVFLRDLDLSGNNFVSLPERIKHLANLRSLKLSKCTNLQEIPELPLNIKRVEARNCTSLERYSQLPRVFEFNRKEKSTRLNDIDLSNCCKLAESQVEILEHCLQSKGYRGNSRIEMFLPGNQIPQWFSYKWEHTSSFSFEVASHACERLAALALCAIVNLEKGMTANISREVFINGQSVLSFSREFFSMETDHVWLYYLPCRFTKSLNPEKNDSIHFEVSFRVLGSPVGSPLKECGVYLVYRQYENADDPSGGRSLSCQFTSISLDLKRSGENNVVELNCYPRAKRKKTTEDSLVAANNSAEHQTVPLLTNHSAEHQTVPLLANHSAENQIASLVAANNSIPEPIVKELNLNQWLSLDLKPVDQMPLNPSHIEKLEGRIRLLSETTTSQQVHSRHNGCNGNLELQWI